MIELLLVISLLLVALVIVCVVIAIALLRIVSRKPPSNFEWHRRPGDDDE